ncbi:hypothetical protein QL285_025211 [Trifolium repens]|nr:hypothetical protein QL285_025211 [Trifolium repens]
MREKEEREREEKRRGYVYKVDKNSISFFVSNFPDEFNVGDLWKIFAHYGSVGDVYIPNKVDKWGKKFAFVKFKEVKEVDELSRRLEDVWSGTFKLRVNKARFGRNEQSSRVTVTAEARSERGPESSNENGRSFRDALTTPKNTTVAGTTKEPVIQVEVDNMVLAELQQSFVGVLALDVEVEKIRTMLFMEGRQHISVTPMGGKLILLNSPRKGELGAMVKAKEDWLTYYFKVVKPWTANMFNDRREVWVKVLGVPLHVWGESFFKLVGAHFGEFVDFDADTASRSRLDVARIKISTPCRSEIDVAVQVKALGCLYQVWVVEEKSMESLWVKDRRDEDEEYSYANSVAVPNRAVVVNVGSDCSSGEDDVGVECDGDGCSNGQLPGVDVKGDEPNSLLHAVVEKRQEGNIKADLLCIEFKETSTPRVGSKQKEGEVNMTCDTHGEKILVAFNAAPAGEIGVETDVVLGEGIECDNCGADQILTDPLEVAMGRVTGNGSEQHTDSFCPDLEMGGITVGGPGGVFAVNEPGVTNGPCKRQVVVFSNAKSDNLEISIEGPKSSSFPYIQSEKVKIKSRIPQIVNPKCIQFVEAVNKGRKGSRKKKGKKGSEQNHGRNSSIDSIESIGKAGESEDGCVESRIAVEGNPEAGVLPSGVDLLVGEVNAHVSDSEGTTANGDIILQREAAKLLGIQKTVGFSFELADKEVCDKMIMDELRDRAQKVEREQVNGDQ